MVGDKFNTEDNKPLVMCAGQPAFEQIDKLAVRDPPQRDVNCGHRTKNLSALAT